MDDDRLASELQRRASGAAPRPDWAQRDLLPAVWREIDARPQPVLASRWSPLAGLATLVVALLVLVVAVPRLVPNQSASPTPTDPLVLTTADFAARLVAGALDGKTVLVNGRLVGEARRGPVCPLSQDDLCYVGALESSDVDVYARPLATIEGEDALRLVVGRSSWPWWNPNWASAESQILVLAIDASKQVEYLGSARTPSDGLTWSVSAAKELDINSVGRGEVVLVDGWLGGFTNVRCLAGPSLQVEGLPSRRCSDEWIARVPYPGQPSVQVQPGAYSEFAPNPIAAGDRVPRKAVYAVAPRLEGWCSTGTPPCWQWTVVARVDAAPAQATPSPSPSMQPSPSPSSNAIECVGDSLPVTVVDGTDLVGTQGIVLDLVVPLSVDELRAFVTSASASTDYVDTSAGRFDFSLRADATEYAADQPINVEASLTYLGSQDAITITGASEYIVFGIEQLDGLFGTSPISGLLCGHWELHSGVADVRPFFKIGGYSNSDPEVKRYRAYFADPLLRLPAGTYRISAGVGFHIGAGTCHDKTGGYGDGTSIVIHVR